MIKNFMNLQIFSFAYIFLISPPIFELLRLSMDLTYRNVTPHFGNLRGRIFTHIMIEIIDIIIKFHLNSGSFLFCPLFLPYHQASRIPPASFKDPQIRSKLLHRNVSPILESWVQVELDGTWAGPLETQAWQFKR